MTSVQFGWSMVLGTSNLDRATFMDAARKGVTISFWDKHTLSCGLALQAGSFKRIKGCEHLHSISTSPFFSLFAPNLAI